MRDQRSGATAGTVSSLMSARPGSWQGPLEPRAVELEAAHRLDLALAVDHERLGTPVVPNERTKLPLTSRSTG